MADTHRYTGNHAQEFVVGDKALMVAPGSFLNLSKSDLENAHVKDMLNSGQLLELKSKGGEKE